MVPCCGLPVTRRLVQGECNGLALWRGTLHTCGGEDVHLPPLKRAPTDGGQAKELQGLEVLRSLKKGIIFFKKYNRIRRWWRIPIIIHDFLHARFFLVEEEKLLKYFFVIYLTYISCFFTLCFRSK